MAVTAMLMVIQIGPEHRAAVPLTDVLPAQVRPQLAGAPAGDEILPGTAPGSVRRRGDSHVGRGYRPGIGRRPPRWSHGAAGAHGSAGTQGHAGRRGPGCRSAASTLAACRRPGRRAGRAVPPRLLPLLLAALSLLSSVAFVLAPVERPEAVYSWPSAPGDATAVAIPLMLERPTSVRAGIDCAAAREADDGTVLLSTTPFERSPGDASLPGGLRAEVTGGELAVRSGATDLPPQPIPASGDCAFELTSSAAATTLRLDGEVVADEAADVRPAVAGVLHRRRRPRRAGGRRHRRHGLPDLAIPLKIALGVLAVLALAAALVLVARRERDAAPGRRPAAPPRRPTRGAARCAWSSTPSSSGCWRSGPSSGR